MKTIASLFLTLLAVLSGCAGVGAPTFSYGASLPLFEVVPNQSQPVEFAPGAGVMGSVGLFQEAIIGKSYDLLDLGASFFGNSVGPTGAAQVALTVGTLNNLINIGIATPLAGGPNGGDFNGRFAVYPVFGLNFPISFGGPYSPPVGIENGPQGLARGGTLYFP